MTLQILICGFKMWNGHLDSTNLAKPAALPQFYHQDLAAQRVCCSPDPNLHVERRGTNFCQASCTATILPSRSRCARRLLWQSTPCGTRSTRMRGHVASLICRLPCACEISWLLKAKKVDCCLSWRRRSKFRDCQTKCVVLG